MGCFNILFIIWRINNNIINYRKAKEKNIFISKNIFMYLKNKFEEIF